MKRVVSLLAAAGVMAAASGALAVPFEYNDRPATIVDTAGQTSLQETINGVVGAGKINAASDQSRVGAWTLAEGDADAYRISLVSPLGPGRLGIFSLATGAEYTLLNANTEASGYKADFSIDQNTLTGQYELVIGNAVKDTNFGQSFGFYWRDSNGGSTKTSYTLDTMNPNQAADALAYLVADNTDVLLHRNPSSNNATKAKGGNDWILAFDNQFESKIGTGPDVVRDSLSDFNDAVFYLEDMNPVPEPGTMMLLGAGFLGLAIYGKRRRNA